MIIHCVKILSAIILSLMFTISLSKLVICLWDDVDFSYADGRLDVDLWLDQNELGDYKKLFQEKGMNFNVYLHIFYFWFFFSIVLYNFYSK